MNASGFARIFFPALMLALVGCAGPGVLVSSTRSLDYPPERFSKGGSVCVITSAKLRGNFPDADEQQRVQIISDGFRAKGFRVVDSPNGAEYGFMAVPRVRQNAPSSATVVGDTVILNRVTIHQEEAAFQALNADGSPTHKMLWQGTATLGGYGFNSKAEVDLLKALILRFPQ